MSGARPVHPATGIHMLIAMTIPLTGTQYEMEAGDYRATVTSSAGLSIRVGSTERPKWEAAMSSRRTVPASC